MDLGQVKTGDLLIYFKSLQTTGKIKRLIVKVSHRTPKRIYVGSRKFDLHGFPAREVRNTVSGRIRLPHDGEIDEIRQIAKEEAQAKRDRERQLEEQRAANRSARLDLWSSAFFDAVELNQGKRRVHGAAVRVLLQDLWETACVGESVDNPLTKSEERRLRCSKRCAEEDSG